MKVIKVEKREKSWNWDIRSRSLTEERSMQGTYYIIRQLASSLFCFDLFIVGVS